MSQHDLELLTYVLIAVTLFLCIGALTSLAYIEVAYRTRGRGDPETSRHRRWSWWIGGLAVVVGITCALALIRYVAPELHIAGLPAPFTLLVVIAAIDALMLWPINLARTWHSWGMGARKAHGLDPETEETV